jgi:hypothetical protein
MVWVHRAGNRIWVKGRKGERKEGRKEGSLGGRLTGALRGTGQLPRLLTNPNRPAAGDMFWKAGTWLCTGMSELHPFAVSSCSTRPQAAAALAASGLQQHHPPLIVSTPTP